jgi:hypothetical protein
MSDGSLLSSIGESPTEVFIPTGPTTLRDTGIVPVGHPVSEAGGLASEHGGPYFVCDAVRRPTHRNGAGQLLLAVGGLRNAVYGCYPDANDSPRTYHWELIVHLPADVTITAVGSFGGGTVHVGASGSMFAVDTKQQTALKLPVDLPKPNPRAVVRAGGINRIAALSETTVFATMNGATAKTSNVVTGMPSTVTSYYVLRLDVLRWVVTPGTSLPQAALYGLEVFTALRLEAPFGVVVTTDDRAYVSRNEGASWRQASSGLPRNPHCADLRAIATRTGTSLYLSTYGRSVYVARFPA